MTERAQRPFLIHQLAEYVIGLALIVVGFQDTEPVLPAVAGVIVLVNAAAVRGPLGAFALIPRKVHRIVDVIVLCTLVAFALQPRIAVSLQGRLVLVAITVPMAFVWWFTDWEERPGRVRRRTGRADPRSDDIGRSAGRTAANVYLAGKRALKRHSEE